jgi:hypothetical protein
MIMNKQVIGSPFVHVKYGITDIYQRDSSYRGKMTTQCQGDGDIPATCATRLPSSQPLALSIICHVC